MRRITIMLLGIAVALLILWDLVAYIAGENATVSVIITDWAYYTPWMPLVCGFLMGHWFWPAKGSDD